MGGSTRGVPLRLAVLSAIVAGLISVTPAFASNGATLTQPAYGSTVSGVVPISLSTGPGVQWSNFYIDGTWYASTPPANISWDSTTVSNGLHTISATAYAPGKIILATALVPVFVLNPAPQLKLTSPLPGVRIAGSMNIAANRPPGVVWENFYIDGAWIVSSPPFSFTWNLAQLPNGPHTVSVVSYGSSGAKLGADSSSFVVVNTIPFAIAPSATATPTPIPALGAPTAVPTVVPTLAPTVVPTQIPTLIATLAPTIAPTAVPTSAPTLVPTIAPTLIPTAAPTPAPSVIPTLVPTAIPTAVPTTAPTAIPSVATTAVPTSIATALPTAVPTAQPAVSMLAPANNSIVAGTISISAQINSSAVVWLNFYSDGAWIASSPPTSILWDSTSVADGPHTLSVTAFGTGSVNLGVASTNVNVLNHPAGATATATSTPASLFSSAPTPVPSPASAELRPTNLIPNSTMPSASELAAFHSGVGACGGLDDCTYMQKVDGQFTGTTTAIIEFEADKWCPNCTILNPLDGQAYSFRDLAKAIAVNETHWYQWRSANLSSLDSITGLLTLTPSHGDLNNVSASQPNAGSWGIFQIAEGSGQGWPSSWPLSAKYTAFNADFKLAEQMGVEQGQLAYLNAPSRAQIAIANGYAPYANYVDSNGVLHSASTDVNERRWGAVGNWYSGGWYDSGAINYIHEVQQYLHSQPWTQPGF